MASWPPSLAPMAQGEPGSCGTGNQGVVGALAVLHADGVDGRHVENVKAHGGDGIQPLGGGAEVSGGPGARGVVPDGPFGAGKELVPGAASGEVAFNDQRELFGDGHQFADRLVLHNGGHVVAEAGPEALLRR